MPATAVTNRDDASARAAGRGDDLIEPLERVTVNLTARTASALDATSGMTGDTKTDTINRALQVYAFLEHVAARGGTIFIGDKAGTELEPLEIC
jgi:hypothetical protein